jgi:hypothetical protein
VNILQEASPQSFVCIPSLPHPGHISSPLWSSTLYYRDDIGHVYKSPSSSIDQLILRSKLNPELSVFKHFSIFLFMYPHKRSQSRGSSVSIVSNHALDDRGLIPGRAKVFLFWPLCPDRLWGPPSLLSSGYWRGRGVMLTTHPYLVQMPRKRRSCTSSPPKRLHGVQRDRFTSYKRRRLLCICIFILYDKFLIFTVCRPI